MSSIWQNLRRNYSLAFLKEGKALCCPFTMYRIVPVVIGGPHSVCLAVNKVGGGSGNICNGPPTCGAT
jgi:hypothetical protein